MSYRVVVGVIGGFTEYVLPGNLPKGGADLLL